MTARTHLLGSIFFVLALAPLACGGEDGLEDGDDGVESPDDSGGTNDARTLPPEGSPDEDGSPSTGDAAEDTSGGDDVTVPPPDADDDATLDAEADAPSDVELDAWSDVEADTGPDAELDAPSDVELDTGADATLDAASDAKLDATVDATVDAKVDATLDAGAKDAGADADAGTDASVDASTDAGSADAADAAIDASPDGGKTCGGGGGPTGGPADLFPCDSFWYKDVSSLPVAPESSTIISAIKWGASNTFKIDFSIVFMHDDGTSPTQTFDIDWEDESDLGPVPIPPGGALEGETGYDCTSGGDCHLIVVDDSAKKLYELYAASNNGGTTWTAAQQTIWDLTKSYGPEGRGLGCTSADAAGLSVMAGLIGLREARAGKIEHALRFILPNSRIRKGPSFVAPATHGTKATSSTDGPPYGTRLRLKATFDESKVKSSGGKAVVRALKKYGMILADGGQIALTAEGDSIQKKLDPTMTWSGVLGANDLDMLTPSDFEVVDFGTIQTTKSCTLLP